MKFKKGDLILYNGGLYLFERNLDKSSVVLRGSSIIRRDLIAVEKKFVKRASDKDIIDLLSESLKTNLMNNALYELREGVRNI